MKKQLLFSLVIFGMGCYWSACSADKLPEPGPVGIDCDQTSITYEGHVQGILNAKCNVSGCHDNQVMGRFDDYATLPASRRENIHNRAVVLKNMPPQGMEPEFRDSIKCWAEQGYVQN